MKTSTAKMYVVCMTTNIQPPLLWNSKTIRRIWHDEQWYFSVVDVVAVLVDSQNPRNYWNMLKTRIEVEEEFQLYTNCVQLKLEASDGKMRETDCANTEGLFRIIQSIPSPKAEPFKRWLAKVGYERLQEIENPELAQKRIKSLYEQKGYSDEWIEKRLKGIIVREGLTREKDFAILTAEISKATFGMTPLEYKKYKHIPTKSTVNLRDHMTDLELIFTMLGEKVTTEISKKEKPDTIPKHTHVAGRGGRVAQGARHATETELGEDVVTDVNYLG